MFAFKESRTLIWITAPFATAFLIAPATATAQTWPNRSIHLIMPAPAGGNNDAVGRILAQGISTILKAPVVVENRTGAGGITGVQYAAAQAADGYTLLFGITGTISIMPHLKKLPYDPAAAFVPISMVAMTPLILVSTKPFDTKDLNSFIRKIRQSPGRYNYATPGNGTINHIAMEALKIRANLDIVHVPYSNVPTVQPLLANDVQAAYDAIPGSAPHVATGALAGLAVTGRTRTSSLPDVPTLTELGFPGMENMFAWMGLLAPVGTPPEIVAILNAATAQVLNELDTKTRINRLGVETIFGTPAEMKTFMDATSQIYKEIIITAKITTEN